MTTDTERLLRALHQCYAATGEEAGEFDDFRALTDCERITVQAVQQMRRELDAHEAKTLTPEAQTTHNAPMKNTTQHTPTPWTVDEYKGEIRDGQGNLLAVIMDARAIPDAQQTANGLFIVQACNAHAGLVEALRECLVWTDGDIEAHRDNGESERDLAYLEDRAASLRAILATLEA